MGTGAHRVLLRGSPDKGFESAYDLPRREFLSPRSTGAFPDDPSRDDEKKLFGFLTDLPELTLRFQSHLDQMPG